MCHERLKNYVFVVILVALPLCSTVFNGIVFLGPSKTIFSQVGVAADILLIITYILLLAGIFIITRSGSNHNDYDRETHSWISTTFLFNLEFGDSFI